MYQIWHQKKQILKLHISIFEGIKSDVTTYISHYNLQYRHRRYNSKLTAEFREQPGALAIQFLPGYFRKWVFLSNTQNQATHIKMFKWIWSLEIYWKTCVSIWLHWFFKIIKETSFGDNLTSLLFNQTIDIQKTNSFQQNIGRKTSLSGFHWLVLRDRNYFQTSWYISSTSVYL